MIIKSVNNNMHNMKNTIKTVLVVSLIVAMVLPFSGMNYAQAEEFDKEKVENIANKATKLMEKLETEQDTEKIEQMQKKLDKLLAILNSVGLYTEEQFEVVKEERLNDIPEETISGTQSSFCPSCNDPAVKVKSGFDYRLWGFYGTANGQWDTITTVDPNGFSQAIVGSWGADYMHVWFQYHLDNSANTANVTFTPYITNSNDGLIHNYGTIQLTVVSTTIQQDYPSPIAYTPVNGGDKSKLVTALNTIS